MPKKVGSLQALKAKLERQASSGLLQRIPKGAPLKVQFLTEPDEWVSFISYFDEAKRTTTVVDDWEQVPEGCRASERYLASAYDVVKGKAIPLEMPKSVVTKLVDEITIRQTIMAHVWLLMKQGTGLDTTYLATIDREAEQPGVEPLDLLGLLDQVMGKAPLIERRAVRVTAPSGGFADDDDEPLLDDDETLVEDGPPYSLDYLRGLDKEAFIELARSHGLKLAGRKKSEVLAELAALPDSPF